MPIKPATVSVCRAWTVRGVFQPPTLATAPSDTPPDRADHAVRPAVTPIRPQTPIDAIAPDNGTGGHRWFTESIQVDKGANSAAETNYCGRPAKHIGVRDGGEGWVVKIRLNLTATE